MSDSNCGEQRDSGTFNNPYDTLDSAKLPRFYMNVILFNKKEVVQAKVQAKIRNSVLSKMASSIANNVISDEKVINSLAEQLIEKVESTVMEMGMQVELKKTFQRDNFVVLHVKVLEIDTLTLLVATKGEQYATLFSTMMVSAP